MEISLKENSSLAGLASPRPWLASLRASLETALSKATANFLALPATERVLAVAALFYASCEALFDSPFVKLGIPVRLPGSLGALPGQEVKIFSMEIFFLFSISVFAWHAWSQRSWRTFAWKNPAWLALSFFVGWGLVRLLLGIRENPVLSVRNSCFVWYLILPLAAYHAGISLQFFRWLSRSIATAYGIFLLGTILMDFFVYADPAVDWYISYGGALGLILLAFVGTTLNPLSWVLLPFLALGAGAAAYSQPNRTFLLAQICGFALVLALRANRTERLKLFFQRLPVFVLITLFAIQAWGVRFNLPHLEHHAGQDEMQIQGSGFTDRGTMLTFGNLIYHSERIGWMEGYRYWLWKDAYDLFRGSPWRGIGFTQQVTHRIYQGNGVIFRPNTVWIGMPPISGPHNSYLNALARMGFGGILVTVLHALALLIFWKSREMAAFWLFLGQACYASLNVGLEGPLRSFILTLFPAMALLLFDQWKKRSPLA